ncbi:gliding motility-associated C-terminal domain-containing protein [candidate division KSB1 bacterium]|nr:gliding motility-associated C-terminal domain-containing protein [candidate division KSB1 bacterium]
MMKSVITFFVGRGTTNRLRRSGLLLKASIVIFILICLGLLADVNLTSAATAGANNPGDSGMASAPMAAAPLTIQLSPHSVLAGSPFKLSVTVGSAATPVVELFGLGFELRYTPSPFFRPVAPVRIQPGAFLQPDTYDFIRHEPANAVFYLAISRKRGAPGQSGSGEILSLNFEVTANAPPGTRICFSLANITANDSTGKAIALQTGPAACLTVEDVAIVVVPNPFTPNDDDSNDHVEFRRDGGIPPDWVIRLMDRAGRTVRLLTGGANTWDGLDDQGRQLAPGAYLYTISNREQLMKRGIIALVR